MSAELVQILTFGQFSPPAARLRVWIEPGRTVPVTDRGDQLCVCVDRVNDYEQVVLSVHGPSEINGQRAGALSLTCWELNFDAVARAICRTVSGRVEAVLVEIINLHRKARAS